MGKTFEEALETLTGPGAPFEIIEQDIAGQRLKVFKNTPPSLRQLFDTARARGDADFLVYEDERWSFEEAMRHVDAIAAMLVEQYDVQPGDRVAIGMRNYPEWILSFAAITSVGAVSVSLNAWWTDEEMTYGLGDSGATVLIADPERVARAKRALDSTALRAIAVRSEGAPLPEGVDRWEDVLPLGKPMPEVDVRPEMDATILYTSGTTGFPKGAVSTHHAVLSALLSFATRALMRKLMYPKEAEEGDVYPTAFILVVPLFHVTGCVAVTLSAFAAGNKIVMMYKWSPERALELIERERVTMFVGVPTQSWDLLESPEFARRDTSSLTNVGGGGAPAPPELVKRVDDSFKGRPTIGYGMTETNSYGPQNAGDDYIRKPDSAGRTVPTMEIRVTDRDGSVLPTGAIGEIWFRGPMLIRGYWNKPEATAETIVDGWLRSGDLGCVDEEGFVYVKDRAKDMVLRGGENVYCAEVEAAIYEHDAVYEAAVFGLPHERLGEEVATVVLLKEGQALDAEALRAHVGERLASFKVPSHVEFSSEQLPRNPAGKILKRDLRDEIAARLGRSS